MIKQQFEIPSRHSAPCSSKIVYFSDVNAKESENGSVEVVPVQDVFLLLPSFLDDEHIGLPSRTVRF